MLSDIRQEIVAELEAVGLHAIDYNENKFVPPIAVVIPADPYLTRVDDTFGSMTANFAVLLIGTKGTAKVQAEYIDTMILKAVNALGDSLIEVGQPGVVTVNGADYFGTELTLEVQIHLEGEQD